MYYVYILESLSKNKWYYGFTERLTERFSEHHYRHQHFTAHIGPWELIFARPFDSKRDALAFEKYLKRCKNKRFIPKQFYQFFMDS